jgi:hypothetical protein
MREQRGVADSTLNKYQSILADLRAVLGDDPTAYTAAAIRSFVLSRASPHGRGHAQSIAVATRAFLRYLVAQGRLPAGRDHAVPSFASWQLVTTPRAQKVSKALAPPCRKISELSASAHPTVPLPIVVSWSVKLSSARVLRRSCRSDGVNAIAT